MGAIKAATTEEKIEYRKQKKGKERKLRKKIQLYPTVFYVYNLIFSMSFLRNKQQRYHNTVIQRNKTTKKKL